MTGKRFFTASLAVHRKSCVLELKRQETLKEAKAAYEAARHKAAAAEASTTAAKAATPTDEPPATLGGGGGSPRARGPAPRP